MKRLPDRVHPREAAPTAQGTKKNTARRPHEVGADAQQEKRLYRRNGSWRIHPTTQSSSGPINQNDGKKDRRNVCTFRGSRHHKSLGDFGSVTRSRKLEVMHARAAVCQPSAPARVLASVHLHVSGVKRSTAAAVYVHYPHQQHGVLACNALHTITQQALLEHE